MRGRTCDRESAVRDMLRSGQDDPVIRAHLTQCERCRQAAAAAAWMLQLAALPVEGVRLPDPGLLWWKAQLVQRWDAQRRAAEPLETGQHVQVGIGLAGCAALLVWLWPRVQSWGARVAASDVTTWAAAAPGALMAAVAIAGLIAAATAIIAIRRIVGD